MAKRTAVDTTRASRDGHEYHETWTARKAMQLLLPGGDLAGIAVEGLHPAEQAIARAETVAIADITLYYGSRPTFRQSEQTSIVQFKYSVSEKEFDFRASDAKKTISKFAATYRDYEKLYGEEAVKQKLEFELITNRPIYESLHCAVHAIAMEQPLTGEVKKQADQFKAASGLDGKTLAQFASKCKFTGLSGSLPATKAALSTLLVDWSATSDTLASARLGQLRQMVRDKAGHAGTDRNVIERTDVLAALDIGDPSDLFPCPAALADIGDIVERKQLADVIALVPKLSKPLLIHAAGGVGKTVFMDSLASALRDRFETVFFDCFGGGAYRSPEDSRHLPRNGLVHIANTLAFHGMCDPILPGDHNVESLLRTFRRRLAQCVKTLARLAVGRELVLFIDAIDNSVLHAHDRSEPAFPVLLLESLHDQPLPGVKLIVSCRTERKPTTYASYVELELQPFSLEETEAYLKARLPKLSKAELNVSRARSGGNPRVLEYLLKSGRGLLDESETNKRIELDDLIQKRISDALSVALQRGYRQRDIDTFLAGLGVLPPPIPLDEYASAVGLQLSAIESFAADLRPLLERTNQGLMFRDEPTETFVRTRYAASVEPLRRLTQSLFSRQDVSAYAARAMPALLHKLDDGEQLFQLAFDDRIPASITSTVGKRNIRYARLKAASLHAAMKRDHNRLVQLLLELSTIASVDQRAADYILDYPDLVVVAQDVDATRRLFETRTSWPGARHARLAIANALSGDSEEAYRHAVTANEWILHYRRTTRDAAAHEPQPEHLDIAAIPFFHISQGQPKHAVNYLRGWEEWYTYELCEHIFEFCQLRQSRQAKPSNDLANFVKALTDDFGCLAAALSFQEFNTPERKDLVERLAKACSKPKKITVRETFHRDRTYELSDGLRKASAIALSCGMNSEALAISLRAPHGRPGIWSFRDHFHHSDVFPFVFRTALVSAVKGTTLHEKDVLPTELVPICSRIPRQLTGKDFRKEAKERLSKSDQMGHHKGQSDKSPAKFSYEQKHEAERFLDRRLEPLLGLTTALAKFLAASAPDIDIAFIKILDVWAEARKFRDPYSSREIDRFIHMLGLEIAIFALWARDDLTLLCVRRFLESLHEQGMFGAHTLIQIVSILAKRQALQRLAGEQGLRVRSLIEVENDVTYRASLYASLARAIRPGSTDEASTYFRAGIEQMDAIGSGDYEFTNELLLFASSMKGAELEERDFHTLTNICELNMGEEPEKFPWGAFARGLSKAAGPKGLAKLSRWDDRSKISLSYTLLPYLTALVEDGKIEAEVALALNRLADPVEFYEFGTETFAEAIRKKGGENRPDLIAELIKQFEDDNPGVPMDSTVKALASLAEEVLGNASETTSYLVAAHERFARTRSIRNEHMNYRGRTESRLSKPADDQTSEHLRTLKQIAASTTPTDEESLGAAIEEVGKLQYAIDIKGEFFAALRDKLLPKDFAQYIGIISGLQNLNIYGKLEELKACKETWGQSWAFVSEVYRNLAVPLIKLHADDLVSYGRLSGDRVREISDLTGVPTSVLVVELIKSFARPDTSISGAVWIGFASFMCAEAAEGQGQIALKRLLGSDASKLSASVIDGEWEEGLYPQDGFRSIAAGLVWRMLGSPYAVDRWRAAHSVRCFARFHCWDVVDALVKKLAQEAAGPFQAEELSFLFMHARLWMLISVARMALDHPERIARYKAELLCIALEEKQPHVLMRHFATNALLACIHSGALKVPANIEDQLRKIDLSPHPRLRKKARHGGVVYQGRPKTAPEPDVKFHLDYDFDKHDVQNLSCVFGKPAWEVRDMISVVVHRFNPSVSSMYEPGGRQCRYRNHPHGITTDFHTYSQHLGWHALFLVAGSLLRDCPVTDDWWYEEDLWGEWLSRHVLTRDDGRWLSDGTDPTPLDVVETLLEETNDGLAVTGDQDKLLKLAGLSSPVTNEFVVEGTWHSSDNIEVNISSSLVSPSKACRLAKKLIREEPMLVWLPTFNQHADEPEYLDNAKKDFTPWIVGPSGGAQLDENDPLGTPVANLRPRIATGFSSLLGLKKDDPFGRVWRDNRGHVGALAQAWGREDKYSEDGEKPGCRLQISTSALQTILTTNDKDLLLLVKLQRYQRETYRSESRFTHTVAVVRINRTLELEYFKGRINHLCQSPD